MGYLVSAHFLNQRPDANAVLAVLPKTIGFTVYQHRAHSIFAIDTYRASRPSRFPFSAATPATDISLELPTGLAELERLYEDLRSENAANGLKRPYISLSLMLSGATKQKVLSVYADDDGNDFACLSDGNVVISGTARCADYIVQFGASGLAKRRANGKAGLHKMASEALQSFAGIQGAALGLGSFDPPENLGFEVVK